MNARFATALHVLALIAAADGAPVASEAIARSVGTNPVVIRRLFRVLAEAGLIAVRTGVRGGAVLARSSDAITLAQVYGAVIGTFSLRCPGDAANDCAARAAVRDVTAELAQRVESAIAREFGTMTLADLCARSGAPA